VHALRIQDRMTQANHKQKGQRGEKYTRDERARPESSRRLAIVVGIGLRHGDSPIDARQEVASPHDMRAHGVVESKDGQDQSIRVLPVEIEPI
jgi:hypothetical protein